MESDFTLAKYEKLCQALIRNYDVQRFVDFLQIEKKNGHLAILRHDVDKYPERSLKVAQLEKELGIRSSYYFRMMDDVFVPEIIQEIEKMGHEIGFHYEVVDKASGDIGRAIEIFEDELSEIRKVADVQTICMHGSPLKPWKNLDLWTHYDFRDFGIRGEPYISVDFESVAYYTDTSRCWDGEASAIDDCVEDNIATRIKTTDELIDIIESQSFDKLMILTHPQRWTEGKGEWARELVSQKVKNIGKRMLKRRAK